nr:hypothetical protein GTC16762_05050 [Pigmentibacter ruber]
MKINIFLLLLLLVESAFSSEKIPTHLSYIDEHEINNLTRVENSLRDQYFLEGKKPIKTSIFNAMKMYNIPGVSLAAIHNGKIVWIKTYGFKDAETKEKLLPEHLLQAASISKPFTVLGVLSLVNENKLELDKNINDYLKGWSVPLNNFTKEKPVTARYLMAHTAGVNVGGFPGIDRSTKYFPNIIDVLNGKKPEIVTNAIEIINTPGTKYSYSGGGTSILQLAIESIVEKDFSSWMDTNILKKLGMLNSTFVQPLPEKILSLASSAHDVEGKVYQGKFHDYPEQAAAGLWTNPTDLATATLRFLNAYYNETNFLNIKQEITNQIFIQQLPSKFGLGFEIAKNKNVLSFGHGGSNEGFKSIMTAYVNSHKNRDKIKLKDALIVMTNSDNGDYLNDMLVASFNDVYKLGLNDAKKIRQVKTSKNLKDYALNFTLYDEDEINNVFYKNGSLYLKLSDDKFPEKLYAIDKNDFITLKGFKIKYFWNNDKAKIKIILNDNVELDSRIIE